MRHPFDLNLEELESTNLDFEKPIADEEAERVGGRLSIFTTTVLEKKEGFFPAIGFLSALQPWSPTQFPSLRLMR